MNCEIYICGNTYGNNKNGYEQYPNDFTRSVNRDLLLKSNSTSEIIIYRDGPIVYHMYTRRLYSGDDFDSVFGICFVLNGIVMDDLVTLNSICDEACISLVRDKKLLKFYNYSKILPLLYDGFLNETSYCKEEISKISTSFNQIKSYLELSPINYSEIKDSIKLVTIKNGTQGLLDALSYNQIVLCRSNTSKDNKTLFSDLSVKPKKNFLAELIRVMGFKLKEIWQGVLCMFIYCIMHLMLVMPLGLGFFFLFTLLNNLIGLGYCASVLLSIIILESLVLSLFCSYHGVNFLSVLRDILKYLKDLFFKWNY